MNVVGAVKHICKGTTRKNKEHHKCPIVRSIIVFCIQAKSFMCLTKKYSVVLYRMYFWLVVVVFHSPGCVYSHSDCLLLICLQLFMLSEMYCSR